MGPSQTAGEETLRLHGSQKPVIPAVDQRGVVPHAESSAQGH